jgi:selenide,water dikinase
VSDPAQTTPVRLTQLAQRAGCAAKQPPGYLLPLLGALPPIADRNVLIGSRTADDAAVYKLDDERALVLTTDFFTPIVDDPYAFGQIACANALSDVYAMGGRPLTALNLVGFPDHLLPASVLGDILRGGADKAREAGIDLVGGHTIKSDEPIYGLAVTGLCHPARVVSNAGARAGDRLVLSKPLGLGILTTAAKQDRDQEGAIGEAIAIMSRLNDRACAAMLEVGVHAATDVTGFGLCGHLRNLLAASGVRARLWLDRVPVLPAARRYAAAGIVPGGTRANWRFLGEWVDWGGISETDQLLLSDAQTSGGLLMAVPAERVEALVAALRARGALATAVIGALESATPDTCGKMQILTSQGDTAP